MGDPLSIAASAAGLVSLGLTVCSGLLDYYNSWKDQPSDITEMCESLEVLGKIFKLLDQKVRHPLLNRESVDRVTESLFSCAAGVQRLRYKLEKIRNAKPGTLFRRDSSPLDVSIWGAKYVLGAKKEVSPETFQRIISSPL